LPHIVTVGAGIVLFTVTNVDDILLLAAFFADPHLSSRAIVVGQYVGIFALVAISTVAALAAIVVPPAWMALLGIVPLFLGVRKLWQLCRADDEDEEEGQAEAVRHEERVLERRTRSQALAVAAVTIANGGDNLGVYIPVFAADIHAIPVYTVIFAVMTALWCAAGHSLVNNRIVGHHLRRYGHLLLPFVLIAIGLVILGDAAPLLR
jgi:cadmium resistance protein CadD (predicted permease)